MARSDGDRTDHEIVEGLDAPVGADEFAAAKLVNWTFEGDRIEATFVTKPFGTAGQFVATVAKLADRMNHHPDIDLHYPGLVHIVCSSHDAGGVTARDLRLARGISDLAQADGVKRYVRDA